MNWRRGLFRFWLVGSSVWIAFFISVGRPFQEWRDYRSSSELIRAADLMVNDIDTSICHFGDSHYTWRDKSTPVMPSDIDALQSIEIAIGCYRFGIASGVERVRIERRLADMGWSYRTLAEYEANLFNRRGTALSNLSVAAVWTFLPPAIILAIGAAVMWALAGFRAK